MKPRIQLASSVIAFCLSVVFALAARCQSPPDTIDVLFVGNSYIYVNNLPDLVEGISEALDGPVVRTGIHTRGGFRLWQHLEEGLLSEVLNDTAHTEEQWDWVVLQEQSRLAVDFADPVSGKLGDPAIFHDAVRALVAMIRKHRASPMLYMTWAKKRFPDQTSDLAQAYDDIGQELAVPVAPVGLAWARVTRKRPDVMLYLSDGSHPNIAGSYLAACVFYAMLTGRSPEGAPPEIKGMPWTMGGLVVSKNPTILVSLDPDLARYLQQIAWETVASRESP